MCIHIFFMALERLLTLTAGWKGKPKPGLCVKVTVFGWLSRTVLFSNLVQGYTVAMK